MRQGSLERGWSEMLTLRQWSLWHHGSLRCQEEWDRWLSSCCLATRCSVLSDLLSNRSVRLPVLVSLFLSLPLSFSLCVSVNLLLSQTALSQTLWKNTVAWNAALIRIMLMMMLTINVSQLNWVNWADGFFADFYAVLLSSSDTVFCKLQLVRTWNLVCR